MPCLIALLAVFMPRLVIALLYLFSSYLSNAYATVVWPLLGFLFMPYTTLAYAVCVNAAGGVTGFYWILMAIAVLADLGAWEGGRQARPRPRG